MVTGNRAFKLGCRVSTQSGNVGLGAPRPVVKKKGEPFFGLYDSES
jgi:hypothetical protein